jgi:tellurite resistance protein
MVMKRRLPRVTVPISFLSMAVGTLAWGHLWQAAARLWQLPGWMPAAASTLGLLLWTAVMVAYGHKWLAHPAAVRAEWQHPVQSAMLALGPVSTLLAAITLAASLPRLGHTLYVLGVGAQVLLGLSLVGRFWQGGRAAESINASVYLPAVAQNFVAATASATFGYTTLAALFFGAGVFSWLALESMVLGRAGTHPELIALQRPLQGIQVAPAVVGGLSYLALTEGPPDLPALMLLGYGLYQALLALRLLHWTRHAPPAPTWWAFSFGAMALATMSLRMADRAPANELLQLLAPMLFGLANLVMAALLWLTAYLGSKGTLLLVLSPPRRRPAD